MNGTDWVLLSYRVPREPSTPRIAVWRKLKRLGVAHLGDGLVGLPADARTREQLEWVADDVAAAGGTASVWLARPTAAAHERELVAQMRQARAAEYEDLAAQARAARAYTDKDRETAARRLQAEFHRVVRRDFFPPRQREQAQQAIRELVAEAVPDGVA